MATPPRHREERNDEATSVGRVARVVWAFRQRDRSAGARLAMTLVRWGRSVRVFDRIEALGSLSGAFTFRCGIAPYD